MTSQTRTGEFDAVNDIHSQAMMTIALAFSAYKFIVGMGRHFTHMGGFWERVFWNFDGMVEQLIHRVSQIKHSLKYLKKSLFWFVLLLGFWSGTFLCYKGTFFGSRNTLWKEKLKENRYWADQQFSPKIQKVLIILTYKWRWAEWCVWYSDFANFVSHVKHDRYPVVARHRG